MLHPEAIQTARTLLEQPAAARRRELRAALPGYLLYCLFHLLAWPYLAYRGWRLAGRRGERNIVWRRLWGGSPPREAKYHHGVLILSTDLGETRTALLAAEQIRCTDPRVPVAVLVTIRRSFDFARPQNFPFPIGYIPYNNPVAVLLLLRRWKPKTILFANYNSNHHHLTFIAKWMRIKTVIINGSVTDAEADWRRRQTNSRRFISWRRTEIGAYAVQTEEDRRRFLDLGVDGRRIIVTGLLLATSERTVEEEQAIASRWRAFLNTGTDQDGPVVIAGSTYPPEEELLLDAFTAFQKRFPGAVLVLAPRTLSREGGADSTLRAHGHPFTRRSLGESRPANISFVLLDTLGELKDIYSAADIAYIGGSFDEKLGGHSPVEALAWGIPMTIGPHYAQQAALVEKLVTAGLLTVCATPDDLTDAWTRAADADSSTRNQIHQRSRELRQDRPMEELYRELLQESAGR